ncbi:hypothetical protein ABENE_07810 [Asticcacaulis benevestitus DSM 16100 = ATCC BAA-896]|uniref:Uncharacterized protein n=1 Tax=Asticcacaulis benevestitus DSM 16100 = ATCC BAA-896 TaxID=1121022 RepID=V4RMN3_9CAUL|nr:hypothetical protein ABENE_07810 [Asticcacaulis benevestitus DSM 16100 = ATCC BAA-896]
MFRHSFKSFWAWVTALKSRAETLPAGEARGSKGKAEFLEGYLPPDRAAPMP